MSLGHFDSTDEPRRSTPPTAAGVEPDDTRHTMTKLDEDTLLDLTVNVIPIAMLAFFSLMFIVFNPWGWDPFTVVLTHFLTLFPLAVLVLVTWASGRAIQRDEDPSA